MPASLMRNTPPLVYTYAVLNFVIFGKVLGCLELGSLGGSCPQGTRDAAHRPAEAGFIHWGTRAGANLASGLCV